MDTQTQIGGLLRTWRTRRRMSQLDLAADAEISQRHLSFVESGRSAPSRDMVIRLAERLDVPLRERNQMLLAAGFAPNYGERTLGDPSLAEARKAIDLVLKGHEPNPAIAVDRHWQMVASNGSIAPFLEDVADKVLLAPPVNVLRLSLHPKGLAPRIVNLAEWAAHLIERLRRQNDAVHDAELAALESELMSYPVGPRHMRPPDANAVAYPLRLRMRGEILSFISTITIFGSPLDVTLSELAIESFFPADDGTRRFLREASGQLP